jgi:hypothetical protein
MSTDLHDLFPEEISDETAFHLVNFFVNLSSELDSHYFTQTRRYINDSTPLEPPECLKNKHNTDDFF